MMVLKALESSLGRTSPGNFLGIKVNALGVVYNSLGLSVHRNTVVNSPTFSGLQKELG
ncbi:MAG: hypothetical protein ACL7BU_05715 [Candidatus Phlomobacter fragariae]